MLVKEGIAEIFIPGSPIEKGPGARTVGFYNRSQRINRDLTLMFLSARRPRVALDAFGGSGIRGIRMNMELGIETFMAELNPASFEIARKNAEMNSAEIQLHNESFERTLGRTVFDYIDIDPYGSVIQYVDKAILSVRNRGYVAVTATDLSALTGSVPAKTFRRYGSYVRTDTFKHEMGLRLLIAYIVRRGAAFDMEVIPELSFWHSHFYRVIFRVEHGSSRADRALRGIGVMNKNALFGDAYEDDDEGPIWTGNLQNSETLDKIREAGFPHGSEEAWKCFKMLNNEDMSLLYLELTDVARYSRANMPPMEVAEDFLLNNSLVSGRTHFSSTGFKIDGDQEDAFSMMTRLLSEKYRNSPVR